jgi:hypothetical protein
MKNAVLLVLLDNRQQNNKREKNITKQNLVEYKNSKHTEKTKKRERFVSFPRRSSTKTNL